MPKSTTTSSSSSGGMAAAVAAAKSKAAAAAAGAAKAPPAKVSSKGISKPLSSSGGDPELLARVFTVGAVRRMARGAGTYGISAKTLPDAVAGHMNPLLRRVVRAALAQARINRRSTITPRDVAKALAANGIRIAGLP